MNFIVNISDAYVWGYFLGRLNYAAQREWIIRLKGSLYSPTLQQLFSNVEMNVSDINSINELASGIFGIDLSLAIKLVDLAIPQIARAINCNVIEFNDIFDIMLLLLSVASDSLSQDEYLLNQNIAYNWQIG